MKIKTRLVSATMAVAVVAGLLTFLNEYAVAQMADAQQARLPQLLGEMQRGRG